MLPKGAFHGFQEDKEGYRICQSFESWKLKLEIAREMFGSHKTCQRVI